MIEEEKKTCTNCGALYNIKHDLPEEDFKETFALFVVMKNEDNDENYACGEIDMKTGTNWLYKIKK